MYIPKIIHVFSHVRSRSQLLSAISQDNPEVKTPLIKIYEKSRAFEVGLEDNYMRTLDAHLSILIFLHFCMRRTESRVSSKKSAWLKPDRSRAAGKACMQCAPAQISTCTSVSSCGPKTRKLNFASRVALCKIFCLANQPHLSCIQMTISAWGGERFC
jgi:hypothetical protein